MNAPDRTPQEPPPPSAPPPPEASPPAEVPATPETRPPEIPFVCRDTTITKITTRLVESDGRPVPGSGTTIKFKTGLVLVDYDTPNTVERQGPGDRVQVCLVAVPDGCPPGDDRGKGYRVFDYGLREAYVMID